MKRLFYIRIYSHPGFQDFVFRQSWSKASCQVYQNTIFSRTICGALELMKAIFLLSFQPDEILFSLSEVVECTK